MSIEAHKCNVRGCKGFIVFENADFDFDNPPVVDGMYEFASPACSECRKRYKVVPHYSVISVDENGNIEEVESACISAWEKRCNELLYESEVDPHRKIQLFINQRGYTYSVLDVLDGYTRQKFGKCYVSHTMKDCISHLENELEELIYK